MGSAYPKRLTDHVLFASLQGVAFPSLSLRHESAQHHPNGLWNIGEECRAD